jgi:Lrp/AsnC family leucine-responsive transcriptional regulator
MRLNEDDKRILTILQREGRISMVDLARQANLSETTCLRRTRSLEDAGIITGYRADIEPEAAGYGVTAFIQVRLDQRVEAAGDTFKDAVSKESWVLECYSLSGAYDHLMKVIAPDNKALAEFILKRLARYDSVRDFQTLFVLDTVKCGAGIPMTSRHI